MRYICTLFLFLVVFATNAQKKILKWDDELCSYEGRYDSKLYSEAQLRNCLRLSFLDEFSIRKTAWVFKPEDIEKLDITTLEKEFAVKKESLSNLNLPKIAYWQNYKKMKLQEIQQVYELAAIEYKAFKDVNALRQFKSTDSCANQHKNALLAGGDALLKDWHLLRKEMIARNGDPERIKREYEQQLASPKKFEYALVDVLVFGWWNCANHTIKRVSNDVSEADKAFKKLFISTKTLHCDEP